MNQPDFSQWTVPQLLQAQKEIEALLNEKKELERTSLLEEFIKKAEASGFELADIVDATPKPKRTRTPRPPKYRDPGNPKRTWSGQGRTPGWLQKLLAGGKTLEDCLI